MLKYYRKLVFHWKRLLIYLVNQFRNQIDILAINVLKCSLVYNFCFSVCYFGTPITWKVYTLALYITVLAKSEPVFRKSDNLLPGNLTFNPLLKTFFDYQWFFYTKFLMGKVKIVGNRLEPKDHKIKWYLHVVSHFLKRFSRENQIG